MPKAEPGYERTLQDFLTAKKQFFLEFKVCRRIRRQCKWKHISKCNSKNIQQYWQNVGFSKAFEDLRVTDDFNLKVLYKYFSTQSRRLTDSLKTNRTFRVSQ